MSKLIKIFNIEIHKFHNVSVTSDQNLMIYGSLDSSHQDASNRSIFMLFGPVDEKLLAFFGILLFRDF
jgi:hypothetical protein